MRENSKRTALRRNDKLMSTSAHAKVVAVSELPEIAPVASIGQINNIGCDHMSKFKKEGSREQRQNNKRERACKIGLSLRLARNRTSSIFRPN